MQPQGWWLWLLFNGLLIAGIALPANAGPARLSQISTLSPFESCTADDSGSQPGSISNDSEVEPWIAVDPTNSKHIVASWQQDRWSNGGARGLLVGVSMDGGKSWSDVALPNLSLCTGGEFHRVSDPWLTFGPTGEIYYASLAVDLALVELLLGQADQGRSAMLVQKSIDGGLTWSDPVAVVDETFAGLHDKQSITADPFDSRAVYVVWDRLDFINGGGPALFSRTVDGGSSWEAPRTVYDPGPDSQTVGSQVIVMPDGALVDFFNVIDEISTAPFMTNTLALKRSLDRGMTWSPAGDPIFVSSMQSSFDVSDPDTGVPLRSADSLFDVAVNSTNGTLYAVWQDARFSGFAHESVAFSMSKDGGFTWTEPVQINHTPSDLPVANQQAFVPSIAVNRKGMIAITYYDFRFNGAEPEGLTDQWAITCRPKAKIDCSDPEDWSELRLTEVSFDIHKAPNAGGYFLGDYDGLAAVKNSFIAAFSVSTVTDPADLISASFKKGVGENNP
jgi:hypothetical protein